MAAGDMDVCLVECSEEAKPMSTNTTKVAAMQELETMDVEPQEETHRGPVELGIQTLSPQAQS